MQNHVNRRVQRLREQARKAARTRWANEARRQERIAALDPVRVGSRIVERLIRVLDERRVIERTIYEFDRPCDIRRKRKELFSMTSHEAVQ